MTPSEITEYRVVTTLNGETSTSDTMTMETAALVFARNRKAVHPVANVRIDQRRVVTTTYRWTTYRG